MLKRPDLALIALLLLLSGFLVVPTEAVAQSDEPTDEGDDDDYPDDDDDGEDATGAGDDDTGAADDDDGVKARGRFGCDCSVGNSTQPVGLVTLVALSLLLSLLALAARRRYSLPR